MLKKILYPTDFSDVSKKALNYIKQLKEAGAQEVIVLHVIDDRDIAAFLGPDEGTSVAGAQLDKIIGVMHQRALEEAAATEKELKAGGLQVKVRIEQGTPFRDILRVEEEEQVSIIIIGSHGKSVVKEMLLGSVSEKVVRNCKKPVLVIKV